MHFSRTFLRTLILLALAVVALFQAAALPGAHAQDPAEQVEAAALRVHLQNLRTGSITLWLGGTLGDSRQIPVYAALGERLMPFDLPALGPSQPFTDDDLTRPVLFNYWASWCPPCRLEFPHLATVALAPEDHAFNVLFVNMSDTEADALDYLLSQPEGLHTVLDENDRLARRSQIVSIPTSLLVDIDGTVLIVHIGVMTPTVTDFFDAVAANPGAGTFDATEYADVTPQAALLPIDVASARPITFGQRVLGTLTDEDFQHVYRFEGEAGQEINVEMTADSSELDPYLVVLSPEGQRLAENDDADMDTDAAARVMLRADGTYVIVATRFLEAEGFAGGEYSLTVTTVGEEPESSQEGFLRYGSTTAGRVSGLNPRELYAFEGAAGEVVTIRVTHEAGDVPLQIELKGPDQHRLVVSDPSADGEATLEAFELPEDGTYRVTVYRERSRDSENLDYTLALSAAN